MPESNGGRLRVFIRRIYGLDALMLRKFSGEEEG